MVAETAARLLVDGIAEDFQSAKRKAALSLGLSSAAALPDNLEVQAALSAYQQVFEGPELAERLARLRRAALAVMRKLEGFSPRLVGPVLYGTPCADTPVTLHVFCDEPEALVRHFLATGTRYLCGSHRVRLSRAHELECPAYAIESEDAEIEMVLFPADHLRQAPLSPLDGKPMRRAGIRQLEAMLAGD